VVDNFKKLLENFLSLKADKVSLQKLLQKPQKKCFQKHKSIIQLHLAVTIKVPCTVEGLKACKFLSGIGVQTNVTLVFSVLQEFLHPRQGATYISPFVGRWMDNSIDGIEIVRNIRKAFDYSGTSTQILAASIRDVRQVEQAALNGADVVTIPPVVFWGMYKNILTEKGLDLFQKDWEQVLKSMEEK
jgi:transaldolase